MSLRGQVTGKIANPVLRWTGKQQAVLELRIHATASARDKATGEWSDIGDPLWVSASFWERDAERLAEVLQQGDRVTVEGTLVIESYQRRDGGGGIAHSLRNPRFLGIVPSRKPTEESAAPANDYAPITSDASAPF